MNRRRVFPVAVSSPMGRRVFSFALWLCRSGRSFLLAVICGGVLSRVGPLPRRVSAVLPADMSIGKRGGVSSRILWRLSLCASRSMARRLCLLCPSLGRRALGGVPLPVPAFHASSFCRLGAVFSCVECGGPVSLCVSVARAVAHVWALCSHGRAVSAWEAARRSSRLMSGRAFPRTGCVLSSVCVHVSLHIARGGLAPTFPVSGKRAALCRCFLIVLYIINYDNFFDALAVHILFHGVNPRALFFYFYICHKHPIAAHEHFRRL